MLLSLVGCSGPPERVRPAPAGFELRSADIGEDGRLSAAVGCGAPSRTPSLAWSGLPENTAAVAVVVSSQGPAGAAVHWTAWDIDPSTGGIEGGVAPTHSPPLQGVTADGRVGWSPICLPQDGVVLIDVAALDEAVLPPPTVNASALRARLGPHVIGLARLEAGAPAPPEGGP